MRKIVIFYLDMILISVSMIIYIEIFALLFCFYEENFLVYFELAFSGYAFYQIKCFI